MDAEKFIPLTEVAKLEAIKVAPFAGSLAIYGVTLKDWAAIFGFLYGAGMLLDLIVRRWGWPLLKLVIARRREAKAGKS